MGRFTIGSYGARCMASLGVALGLLTLFAAQKAGAADLAPNDPRFGNQFAPQMLHAPTAWGVQAGAPGAMICFLDTGVRRTHEDLAAHYAGGIDLVSNDADPQDDRGHGTRTAGVAAAVINNGKGIAGIANVPFKEVKVIGADGVVPNGAIANGIRWCADNGARIVSISLGGTAPDPAVKEAVDYAWNKGLVLVAGAGNGACNDCVIYPAAFDVVIAVGCVDANRVPCSSQSKGAQVDLAAPGQNILTTGHGSDTAYVYGGGTSMSAPHVSGAAALVWSAHPEYTNLKVRQLLESTAQDVGAAGHDPASGAGLVRPDLAIGSAPSSTPTTASPTPFSASFAPSSGVNEWWIDVKVMSSQTPTKVEARVNAGVWNGLSKTDWGTWAKSINAPKGSSVVFKATNAAGATVMSAPVQWMGAAPTATSSPAPAPSFTATFAPKGTTNNWWVEVGVSSSAAIAKVEAREDGGPWIPLPKTEWGAYAKSIHVEDGHRIEFRATSSNGASAMSAVYTWG